MGILMAILILGATNCIICGKVISIEDDYVSFKPFISNAKDPLLFFNDAAMHQECYCRHPLYSQAEERYRQFLSQTSRGHVCNICNEYIVSPDDHVALGHLTDDNNKALFALNYAEFHLSCFSTWKDRDNVISNLNSLSESEQWEGNALKRVIAVITRAH